MTYSRAIPFFVLINVFAFQLICSSGNRTQRSLMESCAEGNSAEVKRIIQRRLTAKQKQKLVNHVRQYDSETPLHVAARSGDPETVRLLLKYGARVDPKNKDGKTPLLVAGSVLECYENDQEAESYKKIIVILMQAGADIHWADKIERTLLLFASAAGTESVVRLLLERGANPNGADYRKNCLSLGQSPLFWAAGKGHETIVTLLLAAGARPNLAYLGNEEHYFELEGGDGQLRKVWHEPKYPLIEASVHGYPSIAQRLIAAGADINAQDWRKQTALHKAAHLLHVETVKALLRAENIDAFLRDDEGHTALVLAVMGQEGGAIVKAFIECGFNMNRPDERGYTPIMAAASSKSRRAWRKQAVQALFKYGVSLPTQQQKALLINEGKQEVWQLIMDSYLEIPGEGDSSNSQSEQGESGREKEPKSGLNPDKA